MSIFICNLIDEFKLLEKYGKKSDDEYVKDTIYVLTPLVNYLKKFTAIRASRNKIIAHLNRDKNLKFTPWWEELIGKRNTTSRDEYRMIFSTINAFKTILERRFDEEIKISNNYFQMEIDKYISLKMQITKINPKNDITPTIKEIRKRMLEKKFEYIIDFNNKKYG